MCFDSPINLHCLGERGDLIGNHYLDMVNQDKHKGGLSIHWDSVSWGADICKA